MVKLENEVNRVFCFVNASPLYYNQLLLMPAYKLPMKFSRDKKICTTAQRILTALQTLKCGMQQKLPIEYIPYLLNHSRASSIWEVFSNEAKATKPASLHVIPL